MSSSVLFRGLNLLDRDLSPWRVSSRFAPIQNSKLKTISGSLNSPLIEDRQIKDCGGGLNKRIN